VRRIDLRLVGEGKNIVGKNTAEVARNRGTVGKAVVEAARPAPRRGKHAIESNSPILIGIESLREKIAQEAAILRDAFAEHAAAGVRLSGECLAIRRKVPHGREAKPATRIGDYIDVLVNAPGLKTSVEMDGPLLGAACHRSSRQLPRGTWEGCGLPSRESRTVSGVARIVGLCDLVLRAAMVPTMTGQAEFSGLRGQHDIATQKPGDGLAVHPGNRGVQA